MSDEPEPTALYRVFGDHDLLLYIGISDNFGTRWKQHARIQPWWGDKRRLTVDWIDSRELAEAVETAAIKAEKPVHNKRDAVAPPPRVRKETRVPTLDPAALAAGRRKPSPESVVARVLPIGPIPLGSPASMLEIVLRDPASAEKVAAETPEEDREYVRAYLSAWRANNEWCRRTAPRLIRELCHLEQQEEVAHLVPMIRERRAWIRKHAFGVCDSCAAEPPAGMTCQACGAEGLRVAPEAVAEYKARLRDQAGKPAA